MSDDRVVIEDFGEWDWSLIVDAGGVHALKPIKYDGVLSYSTEERPSSPLKNSEYGLSLDAVLDHYLRKSETDKTVGQLIGAVRDARKKIGDGGDEDETVECAECGDDVTPTVSVYRDPRTGRDHRQAVCPNCGERVPDSATGRMV